MMSSSGKKIIIIGATSGIGRQMASVYVKRGDQVGITGRRKELLENIRIEYPSQVFTECFDVRKENNIPHLESLIQKMGGLDLLIYNAGFGQPSESLDWELERIMYETNVKGFIEIMNYAFNFFMRQGHGQLAAISSIAALRGNSLAPAYSASKSFQSVYIEGLLMKARKMKANIYLSDIQPGFVNTKEAKGNRQFWVAPVEKAARQIVDAIDRKKWRTYITHRWWLIVQLLKWAPGWLYHRIG